MVNHTKLATFVETYRAQLRVAVEKWPEYYVWYSRDGISTDEVADRMAKAFESGSYNHDGNAIKLTCKALGIKYTRKAIEAFLERTR